MPYTNKEDRRAFDARQRAKNRQFIQEYKSARGCADCGWNEHHAGLEFDHVSGDKKYNIGRMVGTHMTTILREIVKCEVVCGTCHNLRTWKRKQ